MKGILKNPTSAHILVNTIGNYANVFFTAIFTVVLFRVMTPAEYGIFSVLMSVSYVLTNVLDFGTTATIYSYLPPLLGEKRAEAFRFVKSTFYYQTVFSSVVILVLLVIFPWLDRSFLKTGADYFPMALAALSTIGFIWQNFLLNVYFAAKQFFRANLYLNIANIIKAVAIAIGFFAGMLNVSYITFVFGIFGPLVFFLFVLWDRRRDVGDFRSAPVHREEFRFRYTLTYFVASQFLNVGLRMDLFVLSFFDAIVSRSEVGYYAAAQKIVLTILSTVVSITQVLSPGFSAIKTRPEARKQLLNGLVYMLLPASLFVGVAITPTIIYELFFTSSFGPAVGIARFLSLPYLLYVFGSIPMLFLLYTVKKPSIIMVAYTVFFIIVTAGLFALVPSLHVNAPPVLLATGFAVSAAIMAYACWRKYSALPTK
jgi:O-antigen/teichoic acid export membrane protein